MRLRDGGDGGDGAVVDLTMARTAAVLGVGLSVLSVFDEPLEVRAGQRRLVAGLILRHQGAVVTPTSLPPHDTSSRLLVWELALDSPPWRVYTSFRRCRAMMGHD
jgi:hypothetical protein